MFWKPRDNFRLLAMMRHKYQMRVFAEERDVELYFQKHALAEDPLKGAWIAVEQGAEVLRAKAVVQDALAKRTDFSVSDACRLAAQRKIIELVIIHT
ncbi:hypothetical protein WNY37_16660 [Henriciella sp. AS95]|uniref:hypothetical protein n=1 Tax=Henriciella sp. AS95 TaxID=3135782 RepID=UPI00317AE960